MNQSYLGHNTRGIDYFGTKADMILPLPLQANNGTVHIGMNAHEICKAANAFRHSDHFSYIFVSRTNNCSGVAARLMHVGGATAFSSIVGYVPKHPFYVTPNDVIDYAYQAENGIYKLNIALQALWQRVGRDIVRVSASQRFARDSTMDIYSLTDWKARSAVPLARRGPFMSAIDRRISEYHRYTWEDSFAEKVMPLCHLINDTGKYLLLKRSGRRTDAFLMLAKQITSVVRMNLVAPSDFTWPRPDHYGGH